MIVIEGEAQSSEEGLIDKIVTQAKSDFNSMIGDVESKFEEKLEGGGKKKKKGKK